MNIEDFEGWDVYSPEGVNDGIINLETDIHGTDNSRFEALKHSN